MAEKIFKLRIMRYLFAGATAAFVNISILFVLTHYFYIWYVFSAVIAYSIAFGVSFSLQKLWTFKVSSFEKIKKELLSYLIIFIIGNIINMALLVLFVEHVKIHYLLAQFLSNGLLAIGNFFVYKNIVFSQGRKTSSSLT